jgi:Fe-S cluster assembly protein SufD
LADITHSGVAADPAAHLSLDDGAVTGFSRGLGECAAAAAWRAGGLQAMRTVEFPDRVRHLWRYTDAELLVPRRVLATEAAATDDITLPDNPAVVLTPGAAPRLNDAARACGLVIRPLLAEDDTADLGRAVPAGHGWFEALNAAAFDAGLLVRAPKNLVLEQPLRIVVPAHADRDILPRVLVVAETGSALTVVEDHTGGGRDARVVAVTEIIAGPGSDVRHVLAERWADGVMGHVTVRALIDRDARFHGVSAGLGGSLGKFDLGGILDGPGAHSEHIGVTLPVGRQHLDHHTVHRHTSGRTWSNIDFKAAVTDRARSAYTGLIRIEQQAGGSEAYQENRNLLLSEQARADTIPELEILTDDVSCSHGATAAPVDPEQIFYLQSRGMTAREALRLVVRGFVEPTLAQMPDGLRAELEELVERRLDHMEASA